MPAAPTSIAFETLPELDTVAGAFGTASPQEEVPDLWDVIILILIGSEN